MEYQLIGGLGPIELIFTVGGLIALIIIIYLVARFANR